MKSNIILQFTDVELADTLIYETGLSGVNLSLMPGELVVVHSRPGFRRIPFADAAVGLLSPTRGQVTFKSADWSRLGADEAARLRGKIGRVFEGAAWVNNLDVDENITLRARHHSKRSLRDITAEATALARAVGFDELPRARPAWMEPEALARAQWVRALLGAPPLLILEFPETGVMPNALPALHRAVKTALHAGSAAVWLTANPAVFGDVGLTADREYSIVGGQWRLEGRGKS